METYLILSRAEVWIENGIQFREDIEGFRSSIEAHEGQEVADAICEMLYDILRSKE